MRQSQFNQTKTFSSHVASSSAKMGRYLRSRLDGNAMEHPYSITWNLVRHSYSSKRRSLIRQEKRREKARVREQQSQGKSNA